jgi:hypothetical protein
MPLIVQSLELWRDGFSGHGFGIGPAAGRLAAELAIGDSPSVDPRPLRASRFSDGSPAVIDRKFNAMSSRLAELEHEVIGFADGDISGAILVALRKCRGKRPHPVNPVLRIFRICVHL